MPRPSQNQARRGHPLLDGLSSTRFGRATRRFPRLVVGSMVDLCRHHTQGRVGLEEAGAGVVPDCGVVAASSFAMSRTSCLTHMSAASALAPLYFAPLLS